MDKYLTAVPECLCAIDVQDFNLPLAIRLNPFCMLDHMREANVLAELVLRAEVFEVALYLRRARIDRRPIGFWCKGIGVVVGGNVTSTTPRFC